MALGILKDKLICFEYTVTKLKDWYCSLNGISTNEEFNKRNDFSKLKVLKLHFFVCAINADSNGLLSIFNHFYAMPYGHVESDIFNAINSNNIERFEFNEEKMTVKPDESTPFGYSLYFQEIDNAVLALRSENEHLVNYTALELVELSHRWVSWRMVFNMARTRNKYSEKIPSEIIKKESKFFSISQ